MVGAGGGGDGSDDDGDGGDDGGGGGVGWSRYRRYNGEKVGGSASGGLKERKASVVFGQRRSRRRWTIILATGHDTRYPGWNLGHERERLRCGRSRRFARESRAAHATGRSTRTRARRSFGRFLRRSSIGLAPSFVFRCWLPRASTSRLRAARSADRQRLCVRSHSLSLSVCLSVSR